VKQKKNFTGFDENQAVFLKNERFSPLGFLKNCSVSVPLSTGLQCWLQCHHPHSPLSLSDSDSTAPPVKSSMPPDGHDHVEALPPLLPHPA
jgi:hypothetical protein